MWDVRMEHGWEAAGWLCGGVGHRSSVQGPHCGLSGRDCTSLHVTVPESQDTLRMTTGSAGGAEQGFWPASATVTSVQAWLQQRL